MRRLRQEGRFAALLSIEGGDAIANDLGVLRDYHRLGACSMTLCHSRTTDWVDSSTDAARWGGLNELGLRVIREMNRLGMVIDVTHFPRITAGLLERGHSEEDVRKTLGENSLRALDDVAERADSA